MATGKKSEKKLIRLTDDEKFKLVAFWEGESVLWDTEDPEYHNANKRLAALERIVEGMEKEDLTIKDVKEQLINLRTQFGKERRKIGASKVSGTGIDDVYKPKWKFFQYSSF